MSGITEQDLQQIQQFRASETTHPNHLLPDEEPDPQPKTRWFVTADDCEEWRQRALDGEPGEEIAAKDDVDKNTVHRHIRGDCTHDVETSDLVFRNGRWVKQGGWQ